MAIQGQPYCAVYLQQSTRQGDLPMVISLLFTRGIAFPVPQFREKTTKASGVALEEEHFHQLLPDLMLNRKQTVRTGRIWMLLRWYRK